MGHFFLLSLPPLSMVRCTKNSQHSIEDITVENVRVSSDGSSISKEKYDLEVQTPVEEISAQNTDDGHPDGGLTAWLIVAGVCRLLFIASSQSYDTFPPFSQAMCNTCST